MPSLVLDTADAYFYQETPEGPWRAIRFLQQENGTFFAATAALPDAGDEKREHPAGTIEWTPCEPAANGWTVYDVEGKCSHFKINDTNNMLTRYVEREQNIAGTLIIRISKEEITGDSRKESTSKRSDIPDISHLAATPFPEAASILLQAQEQDAREASRAREQLELRAKAARWSAYQTQPEFKPTEEKDHFSNDLSQTLACELNNILGSPGRYNTPEEAVAVLKKIANHFAWIEEVEPDSAFLPDCRRLETTLARGVDDVFIADLCPYPLESAEGRTRCLLMKYQHVHNLIRRNIDAINQRVLQSDEVYPSVDLDMLQKNKTYHRIFSGSDPSLSERIITAGEGLNEWLLTNDLLDLAAINRKDPAGNTMLHYAVGSENLETTILLTGSGASPNIRNHAGETPLHMTVTSRNTILVNTLMEAGAKPDIQDNQGRTPLQIAVENGSIEILNRLLTFPGVLTNGQNGESRTLLHVAMGDGNDNIAASLIRAGAHINILDQNGDSPLSLALQNGQRGAAEQLIRDHLNQNDAFLNAFRKIYTALYQGQSGLFKSRFHQHPDIDSVFAYAREKPDSRTAKALELTAKYFGRDLPEGQYTHTKLFRDIYAYAFSHGTWFGISNVSGIQFWNFFAKPLKDNINNINPPALGDENDTRSVKIGRALRGL